MIDALCRTFVPITALFSLAHAAVAAEDAEYGEYLSSECVTCHQLSGAVDGIPSIIGWDEATFIAVLKSFKQKKRGNPAMQLVASSLGEEEMAALAAYFAKLKPK